MTTKIEERLRLAGPGRIGLLGLCFDHQSSYLRGCAGAPPLIRQALGCDSANPFSETGLDTSAAGLMVDTGDIACEVEEAWAAIEAGVGAIIGAGLKPLCLGGDHAVTYPVVRAVAKAHPGLNILHFDAHPDLYPEFRKNPLSNACPMARILEDGLARRLVQVGIRAMSEPQRPLIEAHGVEVYDMISLTKPPDLKFDGPVFISLDMDVLDPAFAPGVSHFEPGGLTTRELIRMIQSFEGELIGADLVEFNPRRDPTGVTAMVAAKLIRELVARMAE